MSDHFGQTACHQRISYSRNSLRYLDFMSFKAPAFRCTNWRPELRSKQSEKHYSDCCRVYCQLEWWWEGDFMSNRKQQRSISDSEDQLNGWMWVTERRVCHVATVQEKQETMHLICSLCWHTSSSHYFFFCLVMVIDIWS